MAKCQHRPQLEKSRERGQNYYYYYCFFLLLVLLLLSQADILRVP